MKQNQTVTLPVLEAKKSTFSVWCEKENQLFSCVLESVVTNRQVCLMAHAFLAFSVLVCAAFVSAVPALLCLAWFVVSLHLAWKGGLR